MARIQVKYAGPDRRQDNRRATLRSHQPNRRSHAERRRDLDVGASLGRIDEYK